MKVNEFLNSMFNRDVTSFIMRNSEERDLLEFEGKHLSRDNSGVWVQAVKKFVAIDPSLLNADITGWAVYRSSLNVAVLMYVRITPEV